MKLLPIVEPVNLIAPKGDHYCLQKVEAIAFTNRGGPFFGPSLVSSPSMAVGG